MEDRCICTALRRAANNSTARYDAALAPAGIKVTMFRLLRRIDRAGAASISALAVELGLDRSTLGRNLKVLERQALIEIGVGRDERARIVKLSATGRATLHAAEPLWAAAQADIAARLGPDVAPLLDRLAALDDVAAP